MSWARQHDSISKIIVINKIITFTQPKYRVIALYLSHQRSFHSSHDGHAWYQASISWSAYLGATVTGSTCQSSRRRGIQIDMRNTHVESSDVACFFRDRDDIVAIFDYNFLSLRNNELNECQGGFGILCFIGGFSWCVILGNDDATFALLFPSLGMLVLSCLCCCGLSRSLLATMMPPTPKTHSALTTWQF
jgi:hypothetical protein